MPRTHIPTAVRILVVERARECCEYCGLHQDDAEAPHQIDHVIAIKHGGQTTTDNLALACQLCNRHKGSDLTAIDPKEGEIVSLFSPRTQAWTEHFEFAGVEIVGLSGTGRATVGLLRLNDEARLIDRQALAAAELYPRAFFFGRNEDDIY
jgi:hypothetical protein